MNIPDNWIILKIEVQEETYYKVLAGWSGGYLDGDSWKLNSGIVEVKETDDYYDIIGHSGSVYRCSKGMERVRMNIGGVLSQLLEKYPDNMSQVNLKDTGLIKEAVDD